MGMMSAITRSSRGRATGAEKSQRPADEAIRDATLDDSVKEILDTINGLMDLEERFEDIERDLIGKSPVALDKIPSPEELGVTGFVPRLMEAALLIGAITRRMHLRVGVVEGALGKRARPVTELEAEMFAALPATEASEPVSEANAKDVPVLENDNDEPTVTNGATQANTQSGEGRGITH